MKHINSGLYYCFLAAMIGLPMGANADVARWNSSRSYSNAYKQVNAQRQGTQHQAQDTGAATTAAVVASELPIRVADENLANKIAAGDTNIGINTNTLQQCALIYPDAKFEWAKPTLGVHANAAPMCTAIVELYAFGAGKNGENVVVARGNLAAGDAFKCNISEFPSESLLPAAGTVVFPTDTEPTVEDVTEIMNQEQKQGAGLKIIAGTVLAGVAGNILGDNEPGKDGLLGGGKSKIISTVASAAGGGALMAASAYSGKVAGDMIASAGVNAALGSVIGNMATSNREVLRVEKCELPNFGVKDCLFGYILKTEELGKKKVFIRENDEDAFVICDHNTVNRSSDKDPCYENNKPYSGCYHNCTIKRVHVTSNVKIGDGTEYASTPSIKTLKDMADDKFSKIDNEHRYWYYNGKMLPYDSESRDFGGETPVYVIVQEGVEPVKDRIPVAIFDYKDKAFGTKKENWSTDLIKEGTKIYKRSTGDKLSECDENDCPKANFVPETVSGSDGQAIDMNNKARLGTTLTGAGAGAGIGAFSAYQGAQTEIQERWTAAVREYKDSLQKFYCWSGNRFLAFYNDAVVIPAMVTDTETIEQQ